MKIVFTDIKTLGFEMNTTGLEKLGEVEIYDQLSNEGLIPVIADAEVIVTNQNCLTSRNLKEAKKLRLICQAGTGYDNIDIEYCKSKNIAVTNVPAYAAVSVAQHTFAMLFYLLSHSRYYDDYVKTDCYEKGKEKLHSGKDFFELEGKTWGVIGLGDIGSRVARYAEGFNCNIIYYSITGRKKQTAYKKASLEVLLKTSDIISIHASLSQYTYNLIGLNELKLMKQNAILLNLGRGGIINEADLAEALNNNMIAAAGLDVLEEEPMGIHSPLKKVKNKDRLYITPHTAYGSIEARERLMNTICHNIQSFMKNKNVNRVDRSFASIF